jgi:hypothetical protein
LHQRCGRSRWRSAALHDLGLWRHARCSWCPHRRLHWVPMLSPRARAVLRSRHRMFRIDD